MSEFNRTETFVNEAEGLKSYITGVFVKMGIAVLITALVSFGTLFAVVRTGLINSGAFSIVLIVAMIAQFGVCIGLSSKITTMQTGTATALFYGYAALTGLTFSVLGLNFSIYEMFMAFAFASVMFFSCAVIGHTTNVDLSKFSGILIGGLVALILATVVSMFVPAFRNGLLISYIGVILFLFITAWDIQKIKGYYYGTQGGYGQMGANLAIYGAFQLYLDFINIFLYVLRIMGSRSSRK